MHMGLGEGLAFLAVLVILFVNYEVQQIRRELRRLSVNVESIREKLGIVQPVQVPAEIQGLIQAGRKIEAIKAYREATGAGLKEAKDAVERMMDRSGSTSGPIVHT